MGVGRACVFSHIVNEHAIDDTLGNADAWLEQADAMLNLSKNTFWPVPGFPHSQRRLLRCMICSGHTGWSSNCRNVEQLREITW